MTAQLQTKLSVSIANRCVFQHVFSHWNRLPVFFFQVQNHNSKLSLIDMASKSKLSFTVCTDKYMSILILDLFNVFMLKSPSTNSHQKFENHLKN